MRGLKKSARLEAKSADGLDSSVQSIHSPILDFHHLKLKNSLPPPLALPLSSSSLSTRASYDDQLRTLGVWKLRSSSSFPLDPSPSVEEVDGGAFG